MPATLERERIQLAVPQVYLDHMEDRRTRQQGQDCLVATHLRPQELLRLHSLALAQHQRPRSPVACLEEEEEEIFLEDKQQVLGLHNLRLRSVLEILVYLDKSQLVLLRLQAARRLPQMYLED